MTREMRHYPIGPCECPVCAGAPVGVLQWEMFAPRAVARGTCSCRWVGSACVPPQAFWRSTGCRPEAPQDRAAPPGEAEKTIRVAPEQEEPGLLFNSLTLTLLPVHSQVVNCLRHNVNKEVLIISIHRKHRESLHIGVDWHRAATDHRNISNSFFKACDTLLLVSAFSPSVV